MLRRSWPKEWFFLAEGGRFRFGIPEGRSEPYLAIRWAPLGSSAAKGKAAVPFIGLLFATHLPKGRQATLHFCQDK